MKKLRGRLWAKITAYIVFLLCAVLVVASAWGTIEQIECGYYKDDGEGYYQQQLKNTVESKLRNLAYAEIAGACIGYLSEFGENTESDFDYFVSWYDEVDSNLCFTVTDTNSGALIAENYKSDNALAETKTTVSLEIPLHDVDIHAILNAVPNEKNSWLLTKLQEYLSIPQEERDKGHPYNHVTVTITLTGYVNGEFTAMDSFYFQRQIHKILAAFCPAFIYIGISAFVLGILLLWFLIYSAGYKVGKEGVVLNPFNRIPTDLYLTVLLVCAAVVVDYVSSYYDELVFYTTLFAFVAVFSPVQMLERTAGTRRSRS